MTGSNVDRSGSGTGGERLAPHRGGAVLTLGILGLVVCFICGIIAWVMGNADLREMRAGRMDPSGESTTNAGRICGIIGVVLACVGVAIWVVIAFFVTTGTVTTYR